MKHTFEALALAGALGVMGCNDTYPEVQDDLAPTNPQTDTPTASNEDTNDAQDETVNTPVAPSTETPVDDITNCPQAISEMTIQAVQTAECATDEVAKLNAVFETGYEVPLYYVGETFPTKDPFGGQQLIMKPEAGTCGPTYGAVIMSGSKTLEFSEQVDFWLMDPKKLQGEVNEKLLQALDALYCHIDPNCNQSGTGKVLHLVGRGEYFDDYAIIQTLKSIKPQNPSETTSTEEPICTQRLLVFTNDLY